MRSREVRMRRNCRSLLLCLKCVHCVS